MNGGAAASPQQALLAALQSLLKAMSVVMLAAYCVLILMQVVYRFVINDSFFWAEELVRGLLGVGGPGARAYSGRNARNNGARSLAARGAATQ